MVDLNSLDEEIMRRGLNPDTRESLSPSQQQQQIPQQSSLEQLAQSAPVSAIMGAGDELARIISLGLIQRQRSPGEEQGLGYTTGKIGGDILAYMAPGAAIKTGLSALAPAAAIENVVPAAKTIPLVSDIAKYLSSPTGLGAASRRMLGSAAFGGAAAEDDRTKGAAWGTVLGGAGEIIPGAAKLVGKAAKYVRPQLIADEIAKVLHPENIKLRSQEGNALYNRVTDIVGDNPIYDKVSKIPVVKYGEQLPEQNQYLSLDPDDISSIYNKDLKLLHSRFLKNPTFQNAHELQSQLGTEIRDLDKMKIRLGALPQADRNIQISYKYAQNALKNDIDSFLSRTDPNLSQQYAEANRNWASNVVPMRQSAMILNKLGEKPTPEKIIKAFDKAERRGLDLPEELSSRLEEMVGRTKAKGLAQAGAGLLLGGSLTHHLPIAMELAGAGGGAALSPMLMRALANKLGGLSGISTIAQKAYPPISQAIIANLLANRGNQ